MTILQSLKKLHKKMTGQDTNSKTIGGVLDSMQENYTAQPGSSGDTYETVAEIAVGVMEKDDGLYSYISETPIEIDVTESDSAFLNSPDMPLQWIPAKEGEDGVVILGYNWGADGPTGSPAYYFEFGPEAAAIVSDSFDLENTTVKILKKVTGGETITVEDKVTEGSTNPVEGGAIYDEFEDLRTRIYRKIEQVEPLIVTGTWASSGGVNTVDITNSGHTLADVYTAAQAGRVVILEYTEDEETTRMGLGIYSYSDNEGYSLDFSICLPINDKPSVAFVSFRNSPIGTFGFFAGS